MKHMTFGANTSNVTALFGAAVVMSALGALMVPPPSHAATLNRQLEVDAQGADVAALQTFLSRDASIYPQGLVTGYYGFLTKAAVSNFQTRYGIDSVGRVGPITLPEINLQIANGGSASFVPAPTISDVQVLAADTSATISWNTRNPARGKLFYDTKPIRIDNTYDSTNYNRAQESVISGTRASYDTEARTEQLVSLENLTPDTTYFYLIEAFNGLGDVSITLPASFKTAK